MKTTWLLIVMMAAQWADARPRLIPSYSNRWEEADVVLIGRFQQTQDTAETQRVARIPAIGVLSEFKVHVVLKGSLTTNTIKVAHYRWRDPPKALDLIMTGQPFLSFVRFEDLIDVYNKPTEADYLIFLRRGEKKDVWAPATGMFDPQCSFLKLSQHWQTEEGKNAAEQMGAGYSPPAEQSSKPTP